MFRTLHRTQTSVGPMPFVVAHGLVDRGRCMSGIDSISHGRHSSQVQSAMRASAQLGLGKRSVIHPGTMPDAELLQRTAAKERDAFLALYDRFSAQLLGMIQSVVRNRQASEDVHQDVWLEIWNRHAARYNPVLGPVDCWLLRLARSRAIDHIRSRAVRSSSPLNESMIDHLESDFTASTNSDAALRDALLTLNDDERLPVLLAYAHGMSRDEIARQLIIPVGTVKTRIRRGIESLRQALSTSQTEGRLVRS